MDVAIGGLSPLGRSCRGKKRQNNQDLGYGNETKRALYHCNYCARDISCTARVKCAICPDFDLCLECFSVGVEIPPHSNGHDYRIVDNLSFPIFHAEWGADEELLLLEAIDVYGLGNWGGVSEHVSSKSAEACKKHYFEDELRSGSVVPAAPAPAGPLKKKLKSEAALVKAEASSSQAGACARDEGERPTLQPATPEVASSAQQEEQPKMNAELDLMDAAPGSEGKRRHDSLASKAASHHAHMEHVHAVEACSPAERHAQIGSRSMHVLTAEEQASKLAGTATHSTVPAPKKPADLATPSLVQKVPDAAQNGTPADGAAPKSTKTKETTRPQPSSSIGIDPSTGYHARRFEFDPDYDNDAEVTIADMEFTDQDTEEDRQRKLRVLEIYNMRLDEREKRREWLLSTGLINLRKAQALEKKRTAGERETVGRLRMFASFQTAPGAHDEMVEGFLLEQRMRSRIQELAEYRRNGVRSFQDAEVFDSDRRRQRASSVANTPTPGCATPAAGTPPVLMGGTDLLLMPPSTGGLVKGEELGMTPDWEPLTTGLRSGRLTRQPVTAERASSADLAQALDTGVGLPSAVAAAAALPAGALQLRQMGPAGAPPLGGNKNAASALAHWRSRRGVPLDISCLPGVEQLSQRERELCASLRMLPAHYLGLKDMMMRDSLKHGAITRAEARTFFRLDAVRSLRLYDLWASCGWVKAPGASQGATEEGGGAVNGGPSTASKIKGAAAAVGDRSRSSGLGEQEAPGAQNLAIDAVANPAPKREPLVLNL